jgi:hypothetical protein
MADFETFNFDTVRRNVPVTVLADSIRAIAEWLEAEGRTDLARGFLADAKVTITPHVVHPLVLAAAIKSCEARGEGGIANSLRERFLIRE